MVKSKSSLQSSLRKSVIKAHRSRGKRVNNLWLVYSVKTDSDWIIPSDRQLIHWLYYLEANPEVRSFDLAPSPILSEDNKEARATELDAIVTLQNGRIEWHEVKAEKNEDHSSQITAQANAALMENVTYKKFYDEDLKPKVKIALRWLKAIGFAASIRGEEHKPCRAELITVMKKIKQGSVKQLLGHLRDFDNAIVHGMLVRLAISGVVHIDLEKTTYGLLTSWTYHGQKA
ncbi:MAG: hypothetical protein OEV35_00125 [Gallionellaceae bacterium]|nr:hypothetical protein [Gallionellaceae bacterium]